MDPFAQFGKNEQQLQMQKLSAPEKIMLTSTKAIVGNKFARTFVFFYALALHTLIFVSMWHAAHGHHTQCCPCSHKDILSGMHG